jgi:Zn-dependent protease with chaperone function
MISAGLGFAAVAVLLAGPVPVLLAHSAWPSRRPGIAVIVWQLVGLAGGVALLGTELSFAVRPERLSGHGPVVGGPGWAAATAFLLTVVWLVAVLIRSSVRVARARRRHRDLLDVLADRDRKPIAADVQVLVGAAARAWSLPGRPARIVLTDAVCACLPPDELDAVVAHERAHLRQHHDLVIQPFVAWRNSFPFLGSARSALAAVVQLTEFLADDAAARQHGPAPVARALQVLQPGSPDTLVRRRRLATVG